jgi:hypothetical protein
MIQLKYSSIYSIVADNFDSPGWTCKKLGAGVVGVLTADCPVRSSHHKHASDRKRDIDQTLHYDKIAVVLKVVRESYQAQRVDSCSHSVCCQFGDRVKNYFF